MWMIIPLTILLLVILLSPWALQDSIGQQNIKSFEQRLNEQLSSNKTNQSNSAEMSNLITNSSLLDMPRNYTLTQIQADNESISKLYNNSIQNMGASSEKTRQNVSDILSILK